jgi:hypothetical protein
MLPSLSRIPAPSDHLAQGNINKIFVNAEYLGKVSTKNGTSKGGTTKGSLKFVIFTKVEAKIIGTSTHYKG